MKTITKVIMIVLCLLFFKSNSQNYFNNRYDTYGSCDAAAIIDTLNNNYLTAGFTCSSISYYALNLKLYNKNNGIVSLTKTYNWHGTNFANSNAIHKIGTKFLIGGSRFYKTDTSLVFQWIFDKNLDSVKYIEYGYLNKGNVINHIVYDNVKHYYMVGQVYDNTYNSDILLIKTDTAGNEIWKKKIGVVGMDENAYSIDTLQGQLIIAGNRTVHGTSNTDGFVMRLDTAGNTIWQKNIFTNNGFSGSKAKKIKDGNILIYSRLKMYDIGSNSFYKLKIEKITPANIPIWQNSYGSIGVESDYYTCLENTQGNIIISGQKGSTNYSCVGTVNVLNQNGDSLFYKEFYKELGSQNYFRDVIQTIDKGYCFAGFLIPVFANGGTGTEDIWLLKVDSNFCESALPCSSGVGISEHEAIEGGVKIYPNPASSILNIEFVPSFEMPENHITIQIIDAFGQNVLFEKLNSQVSVFNINNLSSGIYFYKIIMGNTLIKSNKLIIQK